MTDFFTVSQYETIADTLSLQSYIIIDIKHTSIDILSRQVKNLSNFKDAKIGRDSNKQEAQNIRSDKTLWLDEKLDIDALYLEAMSSLQEQMNRMLYMGLHYHEAHYAHYEKGSFYERHIDAFKGKSSRKLTTVLYLNKAWDEKDGGELCLYDSEDKLLETVYPIKGRMVIFLSEVFPHEVKPTLRDRYSIAGWFRID